MNINELGKRLFIIVQYKYKYILHTQLMLRQVIG